MSEEAQQSTAKPSWLDKRLGRRPSGRLLYSVIAAGMLCGFLLGNGWSRLPGIATNRTAWRALDRKPLQDPKARSVSDTETMSSPLPVPSPDDRSDMHADGSASTLSPPQTFDTEMSPDPVATQETEGTGASRQQEMGEPPPDLTPTSAQSGPDQSEQPAARQPQRVATPIRLPDKFLVHPANRQAPERPSHNRVQQQGRSVVTYTVQIGAFRNAENAHKAVSDFRTQGYEPYILMWRDAKNQIWHRVCTQLFTDKTKAQTAARAIHKRTKINAYVLQTHM